MDLLSLGFLLLILVASGLIAWVADGLGKKIGKKRISIRVGKWSLRPKHVASLGTILMGVSVSLITIGLVAASSKEARVWLQKGRGLIKELKQTEVRNAELQEENRRQEAYERRLRNGNLALRDTNSSLEQANVGLQHDLALEQAKLAEERANIEKLRGERVTLLAERDSLNSQVASLKGQFDASRRQLAKTNGLLASAQSRLSSAKAALVVAKTSLEVAQKSIQATNKNANQIAIKSQETHQQNAALQAEVATRQELVDRLQKETAGLVRQRDDAETQVNDAQTRYQAVIARLDEAGQELAMAQDLVARFKGTTKTSRTEAMTFRRGEEVARIVVPSGSDAETTANAVAALLRNARRKATDRGAKGHRANGETFEAADIVSRQDPKTGAVVSPDTLKRALVAGVAGQKDDQVLVATSSLNAFSGEPVSLDISVLPNPVVYRRNDTLAETSLDGAQPEDRILAQFAAFYNGRVRERAVHDRMIPRTGALSPFGEFSDADAWTLVQSVKRTGRAVRVQAVADADIRAADPLRLEFRVR